MNRISLDSPRKRAHIAVAVAVGGLGLLGLVFFRTQVLRAGPDVLVEQGNRLRALPLPAPRGPILDRDGALLADTEQATALVLMPAPPDSVRARLSRLAELLAIPEARRQRLEMMALTPPRPLVVATDLEPADLARLAAARRDLPGILLESWPVRRYPAGVAVTPVVGHIGLEPWPPGSGEDLAGSGVGRQAGLSGLELAFDSVLAGDVGLRYVEMDPAGSVVGTASREPYRRPVPGRPLRTRLDAGLQRHIAGLMPARTGSAAVVIDIATGDVLALFSHPTVGSGARGETPPNAAVALREEPGAIFHPIAAALAFGRPHIDTDRAQAIPCRGGMRYGDRYFRCWKADGHGLLTLNEAIAQGCDVHFHQIGLRLGLQALLDAGARLGLGRTSGLELPEERPGRFPESVADLATRLGRQPNAADAPELAAGQGLNQTTLLVMTHAYGALANGGAAPAPRLTGATPRDAPWRLDVPAERLAALMDMLAVVTAPGGAAAAASVAVAPAGRIRGQVRRGRVEVGRPRPNGWFVGVAGDAGGADRIAVGVRVEQAASEETAAALAGRIADYYLRNQRAESVPAAGTLTASITTASNRRWD